MIKELKIENFSNLYWLEEYMTGHKGFICGGCFKNIFDGKKVKDLDIFFENEYEWQKAVDYFDERSVGYGFWEEEKVTEEDAEYRFYYENDKVKAYKHLKTGVAVELCRAIFGKPKEIIESFDFTITKFAYYKEEVEDEETKETHIETKIICDENFFEHLHLKRLVIDDKIPFPMSTFERVIRYVGYGYRPCKETKIKLAKAIHDMPEQAITVSNSLYDGMD